MFQHPALREPLMTDRVAALRHAGPATGHDRREKRRHKRVAAARHGIGWLLVDMGLRIAMPRGAANHPLARGR